MITCLPTPAAGLPRQQWKVTSTLGTLFGRCGHATGSNLECKMNCAKPGLTMRLMHMQNCTLPRVCHVAQVYLEPVDGWRPPWEAGVIAAVVLGSLLVSILVGIIMASWAQQQCLLGEVMVCSSAHGRLCVSVCGLSVGRALPCGQPARLAQAASPKHPPT